MVVFTSFGRFFNTAPDLFWLSERLYRYIPGGFHFVTPLPPGTDPGKTYPPLNWPGRNLKKSKNLQRTMKQLGKELHFFQKKSKYPEPAVLWFSFFWNTWNRPVLWLWYFEIPGTGQFFDSDFLKKIPETDDSLNKTKEPSNTRVHSHGGILESGFSGGRIFTTWNYF